MSGRAAMWLALVSACVVMVLGLAGVEPLRPLASLVAFAVMVGAMGGLVLFVLHDLRR